MHEALTLGAVAKKKEAVIAAAARHDGPRRVGLGGVGGGARSYCGGEAGASHSEAALAQAAEEAEDAAALA